MYRSYDVTIRASHAAIERLGWALVKTKSQLIDSARVDGVYVVRVNVPTERVEEFKGICAPFEMQVPPRAHAGVSA
jgi:hypothetical protein